MRQQLGKSLFLAVACVLLCTCYTATAGPEIFQDYYSTQSIEVRLDKSTKETRVLLTTEGRLFLEAIKGTLPQPNGKVVELLLQYPEDGVHQYWWPKAGEGSYDGSTTNVMFKQKTIMKGEPQARTFCCGLTLEIFYLMAKGYPSLVERLAAADLDEFKRYWFCREINSPGPQDALEAFGVGIGITLSEALPGDFVQLWRNDRSGHSVIFVNWLYDNTGQCSGLQYWSTQPGTNGIGFASESIGNFPKQINLQHLSVARPTVIN